MHSHYRLYVQPVRLSRERSYQVRIGMEGDSTVEYVPVYRSALGSLLHLPATHADLESARLEMQMLEELLTSLDPKDMERS